MKAKTMRPVIRVGLLVFTILATWGLAGTANAQTTVAAQFTLPFEVHWGKSVLPAGQYSISMNLDRTTVLVQSADGKTAFYTPIPIKDNSENGATALFILVRGNERMVRSLNLPRHGIRLIYRPATSAQREILAKADQVRAVPLTTAGK